MAERIVQWPSPNRLESLGFCLELFRRKRHDETILLPHETIFGFWRRIPETRDGYQATNEYRRTAPTGKSGEKSMRTVSFILAFVFVVAGSSMAGSVESGLPGVGTFSYNGTPVAPSQSLIVAVR
jgi:hypothetical protein